MRKKLVYYITSIIPCAGKNIKFDVRDVQNEMLVNLSTVEEMDKNDEELRESIKKLWPIQGPKVHTLLIPPNEG